MLPDADAGAGNEGVSGDVVGGVGGEEPRGEEGCGGEPLGEEGSVDVGVCVVDAALDVRMGSRFHTTSERTIAICSWLRSLVDTLSAAPLPPAAPRGGGDKRGAGGALAVGAASSLGMVVLQNVFAPDCRTALMNVLGGCAPPLPVPMPC